MNTTKSNVFTLSAGFPKRKFLSSTAIKLLAVILMFMDHIHQMFYAFGAPLWLTMAGRSVFPLFLFAAAESFYFTRSKKRYLKRLLFAGWGMTLFTFILQNIIPNETVVLMNNAFSTFFVAGLYMWFWDRFTDGIQKRNRKQAITSVLCCFIPVLCVLPVFFVAVLSANERIPFWMLRLLITISLLVPNIFLIEGGFVFVILGVLFYIFRNHRCLQIAALLFLSAITYLVSGGFQWMMCLAAVPMALYNGKRGAGMKKFFYLFYPAHIGILYLISSALAKYLFLP